MHVYEVRPRGDKRGFDLISGALPFSTRNSLVVHMLPPPPKDASAIQSVTPSDIFNRKGPTEPLTHHSARLDIENKWFAFTGLVVVLAFSAPK
jgi:hypothetical protein